MNIQNELKSLISFAMHPNWAFNHYTHSRFELHQIKHWIREGNKISLSKVSPR